MLELVFFIKRRRKNMGKIKEIWCMHHGHLDVGYTHPQKMLMELQCDYIDQAIALCEKTEDWPEESRFRWTCEVTWPLKKWFAEAETGKQEAFRRLVKKNLISVAALPMHTTPGCSTQQLAQALQGLDEMRKLTGSEIRTAINHDVNGQPWTMASLLLDSGVDFYITGINIHFGGIPFPRPCAFRWETCDGRKLTTYLGEHYSMFNTFLQTEYEDTARMAEGIRDYLERMEKSGWEEDFVFLTAANPPLCDNNGPDATLAELIRRYNEEGHEQVIRFATPEMLRERLLGRKESLPAHGGDWTDYWNFGCGSTPREVKVNRRAKNILQKVDFLESFSVSPRESRLEKLSREAYENTLFFDEHTWGAWDAVTDPEQEDVYMQQNHKKEFAYTAADLSAYLLSIYMEKTAANPLQSNRQEGILAVNPTPFSVCQELRVPSYMTRPGRNLAAARARDYLPYTRNHPEELLFEPVELPPFSMKKIPFDTLQPAEGKPARGCVIGKDRIETPYYIVDFQPQTGEIRQVTEKAGGRRILDETSPWGFFALAEERIDPADAETGQSTFFPKDIDKLFHSISQWNHQWKAERTGIQRRESWKLEENAVGITFVYRETSRSMRWMERRITFSSVRPQILLDVSMEKRRENTPVGIYMTFPLKMERGWSCVYDTADTFVRLDDQQMGAVCRDYLTVDRSVSLFERAGGVTLACPDAPLVQVGNFWFGRENQKIERTENPLLLAWISNNYWDTNFAASQDGRMNFHYELSAFAQFEEKEARRSGVLAAGSLAVGAAVFCNKETGIPFFQYESTSALPLFVRPQKGGDMLMALKNDGGREDVCHIVFPQARPLKAVWEADLQGNRKRQLEIEENGFRVALAPYEMLFLRLNSENGEKTTLP